MNEYLAGIYGTHGHTKVAHVGRQISSLSDLADALVAEGADTGGDLEKTAAAHSQVLETLIDYDRAGRAMAQSEFTELEQRAAAGDPSGLETFFSDVLR